MRESIFLFCFYERVTGMKKTIMRVLCLVLLMALMIPDLALADSYKATVYAASTKMYERGNTNSKVLATLNKGTTVMVASTSGNWAKVTYSSKTGYVKVGDLKSSKKQLMYATKQTAVYSSASKGTTIETVSTDYPLYVVGTSGNYYLVDDYNGKFTGYISKSCVSTKKTDRYAVDAKYKVPPKSGSSVTMPGKVKSSQYYLGKSMELSKYKAYLVYVAQSRLSCGYGSGTMKYTNWSFVNYCMNELGVKIPSKISDIAHSGSALFVNRSKLEIGDIVCFDCDETDNVIVDHIGIYVGGGYFLHASSSAGCVVVSSMSSGYYYKNFCWGRRYLSK